MKPYIAGLGLALCLTACEPAEQTQPEAPTSAKADETGLSQWISGLGKQAQGAEASPAAPWYEKSQWFKGWRAEEVETFKRFPGRASRTGDDLTVNFDGKPTARFSDIDKTKCEGNGTCSLWSFAGFAELQSAPGKTETFAIIAHNNGEQNSHLLLDAQGKTHWIGDFFKVSPDRRFIMVGEQESLMSDGFLEVIDFASLRHATIARFDAQCDPDSWEKPEAEVVCSRGDTNSVEVTGTVRQVAPGQWQFREHAVRKNEDGTTITLRNQTVRMTVDAAPTDTAADDAYMSKLGYRRLID